MENVAEKIEEFAALVESHQLVQLERDGFVSPVHAATHKVKVVPGRIYTKVDIGTGGRYMVENATGNIFGVKGYGKVHRGHWYGTVETPETYWWGAYYPVKANEHVSLGGHSMCPPLTTAPCKVKGCFGEALPQRTTCKEHWQGSAGRSLPCTRGKNHTGPCNGAPCGQSVIGCSVVGCSLPAFHGQGKCERHTPTDVCFTIEREANARIPSWPCAKCGQDAGQEGQNIQEVYIDECGQLWDAKVSLRSVFGNAIPPDLQGRIYGELQKVADERAKEDGVPSKIGVMDVCLAIERLIDFSYPKN